MRTTAAARQKEMKVSMTEEATISLTRLDCGAEKVCPGGMNRGRLQGQSPTDSGGIVALTLSAEFMSAEARRQSVFALLLAEQLAQVLDKAEDDDHSRARHPDKEQNGEEMHSELEKSGHVRIVPQRRGMPRC